MTLGESVDEIGVGSGFVGGFFHYFARAGGSGEVAAPTEEVSKFGGERDEPARRVVRRDVGAFGVWVDFCASLFRGLEETGSVYCEHFELLVGEF